MEVLRPGGLELTRYGLSQLRIPAGGRLLDIGCGKGEAALLAQTELGSPLRRWMWTRMPWSRLPQGDLTPG